MYPFKSQHLLDYGENSKQMTPSTARLPNKKIRFVDAVANKNNQIEATREREREDRVVDPIHSNSFVSTHAFIRSFIHSKSKRMYDNDDKKKTNDIKDDIVLAQTGWSHVQLPHTVQYAIAGHESQVLTIQLNQAGDSCKGEPGTMMYLSSGVSQSTTCDGCCERMCSGESCCVMHFTKDSDGSPSYCALTPNFPTSKVIPIDMKAVGGTLICQQGAFMASSGDVHVRMSLDCNFMRCCCGGLGMVRQKLEGTGTVFLTGTGTMVQKVLAQNETILVDTNCLMAFAGSCHMDLRRAGGVMGMIGGGEGIFNTTITGPGLVVVQSMNEITFKQALVANKLYRR